MKMVIGIEIRLVMMLMRIEIRLVMIDREVACVVRVGLCPLIYISPR